MKRPDFIRAAKWADMADQAERLAVEAERYDDDPEQARTWRDLAAIWRELEGRELAATA